MQKDQQNPLQPHEQSNVWQELLGHALPSDQPEVHSFPPDQPKASRESGVSADSTSLADGNIPALASDPWSELEHAQGTEVIDLHAIRLRMSDQDVEQVLQIMQEESPARPDRGYDQTTEK